MDEIRAAAPKKPGRMPSFYEWDDRYLADPNGPSEMLVPPLSGMGLSLYVTKVSGDWTASVNGHVVGGDSPPATREEAMRRAEDALMEALESRLTALKARRP
jgi:hypothetical protein